MRLSWISVTGAVLLVGTVCLLVRLPAPAETTEEPGSEDREINQRLFDRWRADPEHYARLKRDWQAFMALPREQQTRLRQLDEQLHELDSGTQARLWTVLERYNAWLDRLPSEDRSQIEAAAEDAQKLQVVKRLRKREWIARLPQTLRERVARTPEGEERTALLAQLRKREHDRRAEWVRALRPRDETFVHFSRPSRLSDFPAETQDFVKKSLIPALTEDEKKRLALTEGRWPIYPRLLVQLADKHPPLFPPAAADCPCRTRDFTLAVQQFLEKELLPRLKKADREKLSRLEGRWPDYPRTVMDLAHQEKLAVPGTQLPGPSEFWNRMRVALPDVPEIRLRNFALLLTPEERSRLRLSYDDPSSRERLKQEYFARHPRELQRGR